MRARLVVFPIKGRNWAFSSRSVIDPSSALDSHSSSSTTATPYTFKDLWKAISAPTDSPQKQKPPSQSNVELVVDFFANKVLLLPLLPWITIVYNICVHL